MRKTAFWTGLLLLLAGIVLIFLSGSRDAESLEPTIPALYNINQALWTGMAVIGFVLVIISIFIGKKNRQ